MSAVTQKPLGDLAVATPAFSYAQAAKGRSSSGPSTLSPPKAVAGSSDFESKTTPEGKNKAAGEDPLLKRAASEGYHPLCGEELNIGTASERSLQISNDSGVTSASASSTKNHQESRVVVSTPSSPDCGVTSISTLPKEEDLFSTAIASSDSTWEKLSQGSQNGSKQNEKADSEKEVNGNVFLDEDMQIPPDPPPLKDAPPPAVNFWQQRKEAQDAKAKAAKLSNNFKPPVSAGESNGLFPGTLKPSEIAVEQKKKANQGQVQGAKEYSNIALGAASAKDNSRLGEHRGKGEEFLNKGNHKVSQIMYPEKITAAATVPPPPPPPGDAMSWPTPDSAQDEWKKKAQERAEKADKEKSPVSKFHGKEKWIPVPHVPTPKFSTPLPTARRGGRAPRGGRDGGPRGGSINHNLEKSSLGPDVSSTTNDLFTNDRAKIDPNTPKTLSGAAKTKRASSAGPATGRDQHKNSDMVIVDRHKESDSALQKGYQQNGLETRGSSASVQNDRRGDSSQPGPHHRNSREPSTKAVQSSYDRNDRHSNATEDNFLNSRSASSEWRSEAPSRAPDFGRDFHNPVIGRDRGEGRQERNRGGHRSRATANHGFVNSTFSNGQAPTNGPIAQHQYTPAAHPTKSHSHHERHNSQTFNHNYAPFQSQNRSFRSGSRSQSIAHPSSYGRFGPGPQSSANHHPPHIQTDLANAYGYQPGSQGIMSAHPFNAYAEQYKIIGMVTTQMEYYFSVGNLCKDLFLRKHMDSQGFVFLSVLANFNRIKTLTKDMELIRYICFTSIHIEFCTGVDGFDRLRKREGWQQWVLKMEDRDPSVQNDSPIQVLQPQFQVPHYDGAFGLDERHSTALGHPDSNPYQPSDTTVPPHAPASSTLDLNGQVTDASTIQTPLSAAVPEFAPGLPPANQVTTPSSDPQKPMESSFTDEQVDCLMIVVRKPVHNSGPSLPPFPSASSRTFSNGSIDSRTLGDEVNKFEDHQVALAHANDSALGPVESNRLHRSRSPYHLGSPQKQPNGNASPVFWVKDKETPIDSLPPDLTHEPYNVFRRNALKQRERTAHGFCHHDMDILYQFWSHFLIRNFNARMYQEFRRAAFEDAEKQGSAVGLKNLIQYYDESILSQKVISDDLARDFVDLVKKETQSEEKPAFDKLRTAWRNGAFNMKNRKKIDSVLDLELKSELER